MAWSDKENRVNIVIAGGFLAVAGSLLAVSLTFWIAWEDRETNTASQFNESTNSRIEDIATEVDRVRNTLGEVELAERFRNVYARFDIHAEKLVLLEQGLGGRLDGINNRLQSIGNTLGLIDVRLENVEGMEERLLHEFNKSLDTLKGELMGLAARESERPKAIPVTF